jgi:hypothetical protein
MAEDAARRLKCGHVLHPLVVTIKLARRKCVSIIMPLASLQLGARVSATYIATKLARNPNYWTRSRFLYGSALCLEVLGDTADIGRHQQILSAIICGSS